MWPIKIGITMGDPAGVGPQIISQAVTQTGINRLGKIVVIGDRWVLNKFKIQNSKFKIVDLNNIPHKNFAFGKVKTEYGKASVEYLNKAIELVKNKKIDCLVTAPISKQAINLAGHKYSGHTEFFAHSFGRKEQDLVMMLLNNYLRISLVTRHLALSKVSSALSQEAIYRTIIITHRALRSHFAIKQPRVCVAAFNPHAGEGGLLGKEEIRVIIPAIKKSRRITNNVIGPLPADTAISLAIKRRFDAVIAMYHDQALIPLKTLDFESGVNLTLGLDFIRTSPLHGTGFDIANKNIASPGSLISAIKIAVKCTLNLKRNKTS
jgi:4-hydroxythreonine-4-phosphate dehydrogenase